MIFLFVNKGDCYTTNRVIVFEVSSSPCNLTMASHCLSLKVYKRGCKPDLGGGGGKSLY